MRLALLSALGLLAVPAASFAATLGLPVFTTAPSTIFVTNDFGPSNYPGAYSLRINAPVVSAQGAPGFVGETITLATNEFLDPEVYGDLSIGGVNLYDPFSGFTLSYDEAANQGTAEFLLPFTEVLDPVTNEYVLDFDDFFTPFFPGGEPTELTQVTLAFTLSAPLPTKRFAYYCFTDVAPGSECEVNENAGADLLTTVDGRPVEEDLEISTSYFDGKVDDVVATFYTVGGPPVPEVPLPASVWLLGGALGGLAAWRRIARHVA